MYNKLKHRGLITRLLKSNEAQRGQPKLIATKYYAAIQFSSINKCRSRGRQPRVGLGGSHYVP